MDRMRLRESSESKIMPVRRNVSEPGRSSFLFLKKIKIIIVFKRTFNVTILQQGHIGTHLFDGTNLDHDEFILLGEPEAGFGLEKCVQKTLEFL